MKRKITVIVLVMAFFLVLPNIFAGGTQEGSSKGSEEVRLTKIGYSPLSSELEYFQRVILGMQKKCDELGIELLISDPQLDLNKQVTGLENLLTAGAQSLVICCLDPVAVEAAVDEAHAQGKTVISHVSTFKGADVYVGLDEYSFGYAGGENFAKELKKIYSGKVYVSNFDANTLGEGLVQRNNGIIDGFKKIYPDAEVVAQDTAFDEAKAMEIFETMLQANPKININLSNNDPAAYGVINAVEGSGLKINEDVFIGCVGDQFKTLDLIENGQLLSSVSVSPERTGELMVEVAVDLFNGKDVEKDVYIPHKPLSKDNVGEWRDYKLSFGPMK